LDQRVLCTLFRVPTANVRIGSFASVWADHGDFRSTPVNGHSQDIGQSGNPVGRPLGARARISEKLLADLATVWEAHRASVPERLPVTDPGKLAQIAYGLLPRDLFISVEQRTPGNLHPDEWAILRRVIDLILANAQGAELGPVLETIENALRADKAVLIEAECEAASVDGGS
jgi:hypothetical protein